MGCGKLSSLAFAGVCACASLAVFNLWVADNFTSGGESFGEAGPQTGWTQCLSSHLLHRRSFCSAQDLSPGSVCRRAATLHTTMLRLHNHTSQILFQHIHKAGGTTICHLATFNQHRIWSCSQNRTAVSEALYRGHDDIMGCNCNGPYPFSPFAALRRAQQLQVLRNFSDATVFFSEAPVAEEPLFFEGLAHVTLVRDPVTRFISHLLHELAVHDQELFNLTIELQDPNLAILRHLAAPDTVEVKDNYLVRMYAGTPADALPRGRLRRRHLQRAVDNLEHFVAVFVLEGLPGEGQTVLNGVMNLTANYTGYHAGTSFNSSRMAERITPYVRRQLLRTMQLDLQLYEHARLLHNLTVAAWMALQRGGAGMGPAGVGRRPLRRWVRAGSARTPLDADALCVP